MKIAIVYNRDSTNVINLFGRPNREKIGLKTIQRLADALKKGGHQVVSYEADKNLIQRLEDFMPRVVAGEQPGMVFNVSYGIQGQARYTHVPSILEMIGIPYVASGPLAHSLALDKVVTKMILRQNGLPTPDFAVLDSPDADLPADLHYPMIVKPKNEAVSFGLKVVQDERELREAAKVIFDEFQQPVLVEQYVSGREVNVGLLGNSPPEAFPPVELLFGDGPAIYSYEDKTGTSGRSVSHACPAPIGEALDQQAREVAIKAFEAIGCYDCARVDMRIDEKGRLYILEINSLPSLGEHGSYLVGAEHVGLDFVGFVQRLVEVASARYFGTPEPPSIDAKVNDPSTQAFAFVTQRRDEIERRLKEWTNLSSPTSDPVGIREVMTKCERSMLDLGLQPVEELTDGRAAWTWQTKGGLEGGTLLVLHVDVPVATEMPHQMFRREPESFFGDGIGSSRAPLVMLEFTLRTLRHLRRLRRGRLGVLVYADEGRDASWSAPMIRAAAAKAGRVLVLRPGNAGNKIITQRRGQRVYRFRAEGKPRRVGKAPKSRSLLRWAMGKLEELSQLATDRPRSSISTLDLKVDRLPMLLPHRVTATVLVTYPDPESAEQLESEMRATLDQKRTRWELQLVSDRPPMRERRGTTDLRKSLEEVATQWGIPLRHESSVWPSVAGLVDTSTPCLCGIGPVAHDLGTPDESVERISLVQRTLLLTQFLLRTEKA